MEAIIHRYSLFLHTQGGYNPVYTTSYTPREAITRVYTPLLHTQGGYNPGICLPICLPKGVTRCILPYMPPYLRVYKGVQGYTPGCTRVVYTQGVQGRYTQGVQGRHGGYTQGVQERHGGYTRVEERGIPGVVREVYPG